jgi:hypothetical protein
LSVAKVPHWLPHAAPLLGVQHPPSARHTWLVLAHALKIPNRPQLIVWLQLLIAWPHCFVPQAASCASGWHWFEPHVPQLMAFPQLSVVCPQRPVHQPDSLWHTHTLAVPQALPAEHCGHCRDPPQLSGPVAQCVSHQPGSGVQPASAAASGARRPESGPGGLLDPLTGGAASGVTGPSGPSDP